MATVEARRGRAAWMVAASLLGATAPAAAQTRSEAETRFERGAALFSARNYEGALVEFQRSLALSGGVDLLFNIGRTYQAMARYPEAAAAIEAYLRGARDLSTERRQEVGRMLATLRGFIAHVRVRVTPPDAVVTLDGAPVAAERLGAGWPVNPGRHVVAAHREGFAPASEAVVVASGEARDVALTLGPAPGRPGEGSLVVRGAPPGAVLRVDGEVVRAPARLPGRTHRVELSAPGFAPWQGDVLIEPQRDRVLTARFGAPRGLGPGWFVAGACATGAALLVGGVFGGLTLGARADFDARPRYDDVTADRDLAAQGDALRTAANVGFVAAAALGVATVVLLTQTRFGARRPTVDVAASGGRLQWRF